MVSIVIVDVSAVISIDNKSISVKDKCATHKTL